jgi:hypothetical protein
MRWALAPQLPLGLTSLMMRQYYRRSSIQLPDVEERVSLEGVS